MRHKRSAETNIDFDNEAGDKKSPAISSDGGAYKNNRGVWVQIFDPKLYLKAFVSAIFLFLLGLGIQQFVAARMGGGIQKPLYERLSNAALLPAVWYLAGGIFSWANSFGFFDVLGLGFKQKRWTITGNFRDEDGNPREAGLHEYRLNRYDAGTAYTKRHRLIVGLVFLILSFIFAMISLQAEA
ncbi:MAG: hypothetical protein Q4E09_00555 [Eubacteriales bacterium]|nr:hypothetical protein [Eubacteriales bacterium]